MDDTMYDEEGSEDPDVTISRAVERESERLRRFIRQRVSNELDVEDILQDVFSELVEAYRLMRPVEQVAAWMFRVARNRITDLFRKKKPEPAPKVAEPGEGEEPQWEDLLPSPNDGPEAAYARTILLEELEEALDELPDEQREVFIANEIDGISFKDLSRTTGVNLNTLLSRKRYAVLYLKQRLQEIYDEL